MPLTACVCFWTHVENLWKRAAPLWVGRLLRGADQSQPLVKQSRSAAALLQAPLDQWPSGQCVQGCGGGAVQLRMQPQLSRLAPPTEALQRSPLPDPALCSALTLIPAPLHQRTTTKLIAVQRCVQLTLNLGWAQSITALPVELRWHGLIQNPSPAAPQRCIQHWCRVALLHRISAVAPPSFCGCHGENSAVARCSADYNVVLKPPLGRTGSTGPSRSER